MNKERLLILAEFLETLTPKQFNIWAWVKKGDPTSEEPCGTVACAWGWATAILSFRRAGLMLDNTVHCPLYENYYGFFAAVEFLSISMQQAEHLFDGESYSESSRQITPDMVAKRIRAFVESDGGVGSSAG